jgi:U1 small nuclear ribonucleoprotein A
LGGATPPWKQTNMSTEIAPNQTIYVNNLNEKVKLDDLKRELQAIFAQFGKIKDIICMKGMIRATPRPQFRKGQAWVVFDNVDSAKKALTQMQGFPFHDKQMVSVFSNTIVVCSLVKLIFF